MTLCPKCKTELDSAAVSCNVCGWETDENQTGWTVIGSVDDRLMADLARETLQSLGIPAVIRSRDGFFGDAGLVFTPFFKQSEARYPVSVPTAHRAEAIEALEATLGDKYHQGEN